MIALHFGGGEGNHSSLGCSCIKPWALLDRWSWVLLVSI
jgi:hypothetical protein